MVLQIANYKKQVGRESVFILLSNLTNPLTPVPVIPRSMVITPPIQQFEVHIILLYELVDLLFWAPSSSTLLTSDPLSS